MPYTDVRTLLAYNMKRYRTILNISQMALAGRVGCSSTMIGNVETLKRFPSPENLNKIAHALKVHPSELFREDSLAINEIQALYALRALMEANLRRAIGELLADGDIAEHTHP